jgi:hypothetical protein
MDAMRRRLRFVLTAVVLGALAVFVLVAMLASSPGPPPSPAPTPSGPTPSGPTTTTPAPRLSYIGTGGRPSAAPPSIRPQSAPGTGGGLRISGGTA